MVIRVRLFFPEVRTRTLTELVESVGTIAVVTVVARECVSPRAQYAATCSQTV